MSTLGNRIAYLNTAEYVLDKVLELLHEDGERASNALAHTFEAYELVFKAREADIKAVKEETG